MAKVPLHDSSLDHAFNGLDVAESDDKLIIALDFGTTYSGIAYGFTGSGQTDPISIREWPGSRGQNVPKTPTIICYDARDRSSFSWGSVVELMNTDRIEGVKLLLDPDQPTPLFVPTQSTKKQLANLGRPPVDVASDYMGAIFKYGLERIARAFDKDYLDMQQKKYVLTVPAVWSDKAKDLTLRAAKNAGMFPVTLIKEPEAAALYTFHSLKNKSLAVGDAFVLCDAGGGTVDLISYQVTEVSPLKLKELVPGTGGLAGSLMLNKRFEELVKNIVGEEEFLALRKTKAFSSAMGTFDQEVKRDFKSYQDEDQSWYVSFPMAKLKDDPENNLEADVLTLTNDAVKQIFEPVISAILALVAEQVDKVRVKRLSDNHPKGKDIKAIFLVGGFGSNEFLRMCLEKANPGIQIIQPPDAWSAIVQGAVLSQLPRDVVPNVTSTVATRHYGVSANNLYLEGEDSEQKEKRIMDHYEKVWRVAKMTWYIQIGEDLYRDQRIEFPFVRKLDADYKPHDLIFKDDLLVSKAIEAVRYPKEGITKICCSLKTDLRQIPRYQFKDKVAPDGTQYVSIGYNLVIETKNANLEFFMEMNGKVLGRVEADYK